MKIGQVLLIVAVVGTGVGAALAHSPERVLVASRQVVEIGRVVRELGRPYAIAARISWVVLDSVGVAACFIDSALK